MRPFALLLSVMLCTVAAMAQKDSLVKIPIEVSAQANVYFGEITDTSKVRGGAGVPPVEIDIRGVKMITFENPEGLVSAFGEYDSTYFGADGGNYGSKTAISLCGSFSGINHDNKVMFLTGVIVSDYSRLELPLPEEDFTNIDNKLQFTPSYDQPFFIGDGKTKDGAVQRWRISRDATTLYIGFADCLSGPPSNYSNNAGTIKTTVVLYYDDKGMN